MVPRPTGADSAENHPADRRLSTEQTERRDGRANPEPVANPLAGFMAGWMTPQDFKLLQSAPGATDAAGRVARGESSFGVPSTEEAGGANALGAFGRPIPARSPVPVRENPFLQDFAPPTAQTATNRGVAVPPPPAANAPPPKVAAPPPVVSPPPPSALPAFVKPNDDAKYFKPLKRF